VSDDDDWFAPKRYGFGATPSSWQGWALLAAYIAVISGLGFLIPRIGWVGYASVMIMLTVTLIVVVARKTRGGLHWRQGGEEE
jgi:hypothetical protein